MLGSTQQYQYVGNKLILAYNIGPASYWSGSNFYIVLKWIEVNGMKYQTLSHASQKVKIVHHL